MFIFYYYVEKKERPRKLRDLLKGSMLKEIIFKKVKLFHCVFRNSFQSFPQCSGEAGDIGQKGLSLCLACGRPWVLSRPHMAPKHSGSNIKQEPKSWISSTFQLERQLHFTMLFQKDLFLSPLGYTVSQSFRHEE